MSRDDRSGTDKSESGKRDAALDDIEPQLHSWLDANSDRFDSFTLRTDEKTEYYRKAFCEAGLYLYVLDSIGDRPAESAVPTMRETILEQVNDPKFSALVRREPRHFLMYAYPVVYTEKVDELTPANADAIRDVLGDRTVWGFERTPHRMLDMWFFCHLYGRECDFDFESIVELSCLTHPPDPVTATIQDAYALTHNLLYYRKFGIEAPSTPTRFDLDDVILGLLLRFLYEDNADIVLELLIGGVFEESLSPAVVNTIVDWMDTKVHPTGFVPGPDQSSSDGTSDPAVQEWEQNYHTTLVAGMAVLIVRNHWRSENSRTEPISDLLKLGEIISLFSEYQLEEGAKQLLEISESPIVRRYPDMIDMIVGYLRRQKTDEGTYGYWTDEALLYESFGDSPERFQELVDETSEVCAEAIQELDPPG